MNWVDWTIIGIIAISAVLSLRRGFVKEAISLASWVAAFIVGRLFSDVLADIISGYLDVPPSVHLLIAFSVLFIATLIVGNLLASLIGGLVHATGLSATDRILGVGFGVLRDRKSEV